jgi:uncharacterized secreted protein with C-terminal beta-propeller domain
VAEDELKRWLRAVRPSTAADDNWADSAAADESLAAVHRRLDRRRQHGRVRRRLVIPSLATVLGATAAVLLAVGILAPATHEPPTSGPQAVRELPAIRPVAMLLDSYDSCGQLLDGLREHTAANTGPYGLPGVRLYPTPAVNTAGGAATDSSTKAMGLSSPGQTSTTNVQEAGVDEPDIVKTDGGRVVTLTDGVLRVLDAQSARVTGSLDLTMYAGWQGGQLLISGEHALVILGGGAGAGYGGRGLGPMPAAADPGQRSTYLFVDLAGTPKVTGSLRADGGYLDARMVGSTVRLVVHSTPDITFPVPQGNDAQRQQRYRGIVEKAPLSAWLPQYTLTEGSTSTEHDVPCGRVSHPADYTGASLVTIYTVDLTKPDQDPQPLSVVADGDTVYASQNSLYVASNADWYCCAIPNRADKPQPTQIHRFDISGAGAPAYLGSGSVPGRLLSSYSLSDYEGHLRVATTSVANPTAQSSSVYVLDDATLKITGKVDGLGPGEQIYAVRFLGPLGYVVTFRQTDPLYVLDLRDPAAPRAAGELKITGYSDYLHDAGDGRLVGVGQEADGNGRVAGLQVSLFDVHDPAKPTRTAQVVRADAPGEARQDPHAFLYWAPSGLVAFPIQSWQASQAGKLLVLRVHGAQLSTVGVLANPATSSADGTIQRALIVDGTLWTLSSSGVQVSGQESLDRQAWIPFS